MKVAGIPGQISWTRTTRCPAAVVYSTLQRHSTVVSFNHPVKYKRRNSEAALENQGHRHMCDTPAVMKGSVSAVCVFRQIRISRWS